MYGNLYRFSYPSVFPLTDGNTHTGKSQNKEYHCGKGKNKSHHTEVGSCDKYFLHKSLCGQAGFCLCIGKHCKIDLKEKVGKANYQADRPDDEMNYNISDRVSQF